MLLLQQFAVGRAKLQPIFFLQPFAAAWQVEITRAILAQVFGLHLHSVFIDVPRPIQYLLLGLNKS